MMFGIAFLSIFHFYFQDHANKTVTIEAHPHLHSTHMASIHPCRHADIMKRLIDQFAQSGKELIIEEYLIIFLKFLQVLFSFSIFFLLSKILQAAMTKFIYICYYKLLLFVFL